LLDGDSFIVSNDPAITVKEGIQQAKDYLQEQGASGFGFMAIPYTFKKTKLIHKIQYYEYLAARSMHHILNRTGTLRCIPGAGGIFRSNALIEALQRHSLEHDGDDMEITAILQGLGYKLGYCNKFISVLTIVPDSWLKLIRQRIRWRRGALKTYYYCWPFYSNQIKGLHGVGLLCCYEMAIVIGTPLLWFNIIINPLGVFLLSIATGMVIQSVFMAINPEFRQENKANALIYLLPQIVALFAVDIISIPFAFCQAARAVLAKSLAASNRTWFKNPAFTQKALPVLAVLFGAINLVALIKYGMIVTHVYTILVGVYIFTRVVPGMVFYRTPGDNGIEPAISIIIPAYNEEASVAETIDSALSTGYPMDKVEVIAINDGSIDGTLAAMQKAASRHPNVRLINFEQNKGKREALYAGVKAATGDIIVVVDSDSYPSKGSLYQIVQPFADPAIHAVSGHTDVQNTDVNTLTRMQSVWYYVMFRIFKAGESVFGLVSCCPGCFSAYRTEALLNVLEDFRSQEFAGARCTYGDDRSLTNMILRNNGRVIYHNRAHATTLVPEKFKVYLRQQLRWKRSWIRESLTVASKFMWRKNPVIGLTFYIAILVAFVSPLIVLYHVVWMSMVNGVSIWLYVLGVTMVPVLCSVYYLIHHRQNPKGNNFIHGLMSMYMYLTVLGSLNYYAFSTLVNNSWGTRAVSNTRPSKFKSLLRRISSLKITHKKPVQNKPAVNKSALRIVMAKMSTPIASILLIMPVLLAIYGVFLYPSIFFAADLATLTQFYTFTNNIVFYISSTLYQSIYVFFSSYWIGIIGAGLFIFAIFFVWRHVSELTNGQNTLFIELLERHTEGLDNGTKKKVAILASGMIREIMLQDQYKTLSWGYLAGKIPGIRNLLKRNGFAHQGKLLSRPVGWILDILTMLILYRFFLKHFLLPIGLVYHGKRGCFLRI